jgi:hypothetical protein
MEMRPLVEEDGLEDTDGLPGVVDTQGLGVGMSSFGTSGFGTGDFNTSVLDTSVLDTGTGDRTGEDVDNDVFRTPTMLVDDGDREMVPPVMPVRLDVLLASADAQAEDPAPSHHDAHTTTPSSGRGTGSSITATASSTTKAIVHTTPSVSTSITQSATSSSSATSHEVKGTQREIKGEVKDFRTNADSRTRVVEGAAANVRTRNHRLEDKETVIGAQTSSNSAKSAGTNSGNAPTLLSSASEPPTSPATTTEAQEPATIASASNGQSAPSAASDSVEATSTTTPNHQVRREEIEDQSIRHLQEEEMDLNVSTV